MGTYKKLFVVLFILNCAYGSSAQVLPVRAKVKQIYTAQIGVREKTGHNDGVLVEIFLKYCGLPKGQPWCAAFVCWTFNQAGVKNPRSGYCPDLFAAKYVIWRRTNKDPQLFPRPGDIFGIYFPEKGRIAHTGFVDRWETQYVITTEGNTNEAGSREGDGVYRKRRSVKSIYAAANYIDR